MAKILVVDDHAQIGKAIEKFLKNAGHETDGCSNGKEALELLRDAGFDLILTDLKMPVMDGLEFLSKIRAGGIETPVILLTGHGSVDSAVEAMKMGASDYISKPLQLPELKVRIERLLESTELRAENKRLISELRNKHGVENIIGESAAMKRVFDTMRPLTADGNISVLIEGETGTGKELVAKAIHYTGPRAERPFVAINCGALPEHLLESELFGHEKGAFTDASVRKRGLFETADGGTLFLDEIDSMSPDVQVKLLRALEEKSVRRVGGTEDIPLDIRIITATNVSLAELVESGEFRRDLFYRVSVAPLLLPPLREREEDIELLLAHFSNLQNRNGHRAEFSKELISTLEKYEWPGNVRELENLVHLLAVTCSGRITTADLPPAFRTDIATPDAGANEDLKSATKTVVENFERKFLLQKLREHHWNISQTADSIGVSRAALHTKIKHLNLKA